MSVSLELISPSVLRLSGDWSVIKEWREHRKKYVPNAEHTKQFKKGHWDGYKKPGVKRGKYLYVYRGLLSAILADFKLSMDDVRHSYTPKEISVTPFLDENPSLRDYQSDSLEFIASEKWGKIAHATNAGKGFTIAGALTSALDAGLRVLVLCDEVAVFQALEGEISKWASVSLGTVEGGRKDPPSEQVVLGMVKTLANRVKKWEDFFGTFDMVLLDEADRATAASWKTVLKELYNTEFRIGFSGSFPSEDSLDGFVLEELIGPTLSEVKNVELVERGISARPVVELWPYEAYASDYHPDWFNLSGPEKRNWVYQNRIIRNNERHNFISRLLHPSERNVIIVNRVEHGERLVDFIPDSVYLHGSVPKDEREAVLSAFESGEFQNLITTKILDRGSNKLGNAYCIIFASGEGSATQTLQRVGRGLRRGSGKEFVWFRDVIDKGHDYLSRAAKKRIKLYNSEDFDILVKR